MCVRQNVAIHTNKRIDVDQKKIAVEWYAIRKIPEGVSVVAAHSLTATGFEGTYLSTYSGLAGMPRAVDS